MWICQTATYPLLEDAVYAKTNPLLSLCVLLFTLYCHLFCHKHISLYALWLSVLTPPTDKLIHEFIYAAAIKNSTNQCATKWNKAKIINLWKIKRVIFHIYACAIYIIRLHCNVLWSLQYCAWEWDSPDKLNLFLYNFYPGLI